MQQRCQMLLLKVKVKVVFLQMCLFGIWNTRSSFTQSSTSRLSAWDLRLEERGLQKAVWWVTEFSQWALMAKQTAQLQPQLYMIMTFNSFLTPASVFFLVKGFRVWGVWMSYYILRMCLMKNSTPCLPASVILALWVHIVGAQWTLVELFF